MSLPVLLIMTNGTILETGKMTPLGGWYFHSLNMIYTLVFLESNLNNMGKCSYVKFKKQYKTL